jgi:hypothetical protein
VSTERLVKKLVIDVSGMGILPVQSHGQDGHGTMVSGAPSCLREGFECRSNFARILPTDYSDLIPGHYFIRPGPNRSPRLIAVSGFPLRYTRLWA